jgi:glycine oxidase
LKFRPPGKEKDYHVLAKGGGVVWVGSTVEDVGFDADVTEAGTRELLEAARVIFPEAGERDVIRAWAGLRPQALKRGGPFVGPLPGHEGVWVHCGHYRSGILLSPLTARLLAAQMAGDADAIRREGFQPEDLGAFRVDRQE